ncbi:MAG: acyl-CoA dehydrogenase family protein [Pseudomonadota bacterium]
MSTSLKSELIGRAAELAPLVAAESANAERNGAVSSNVIEAFCDAGFMQIMVPKRYGGHELGYDTMAGVVAAIAPACTSTAWVTSFLIGHNYIHALFPQQLQDEIFGDRPWALTPGTIAPSFTLTPVDGGFTASGRSAWNSGSNAAEWVLCSGMVPPAAEGQPPELRVFLVPAADATFIPNWEVAGMKGTSSNDMALDGTFVPEYRTARTLDVLDGRSPGASIHANPIYSLPILPFILGEVVPVVVGAYRGAADEYQRQTAERHHTFTAAKVASKQTAQIRVGRGQTGAALAEAMLKDYVELLSNPDPDALRDPLVRAGIKSRVAAITEFCWAGINELMNGAGANAFRSDSPLQRFQRDINMLHVHGFLDVESASETYGRMILGLPPETPI